MRQWLEKMTNDITGFRPWRYLNYKRYEDWVERWGALLNEFQSAKQDILDHYDKDIEDLKRDYEEIAERSWQSIRSLGYEAIIYNDRAFTDKTEFAQYMIERVLEKVPSKHTIELVLQADYRVSIIEGQEQIEEHYLKSETIRAEAAVVRAQAEAKIAIEKAKLNAQLDEEYAQARMLQEQERHNSEMNLLAEQEKRAKIDAMIRAEADHIRQQFAKEVSPIEEVFTQLRKEMAEICLGAAESVKKNGYVRGKTAEKLRGLVEFYQLSSIQEDPVLLQKLQELRKAVGPVGDERTKDMPERSPEEVIGALKQVIDLQNTIKQDLAQGPSRISLID
jgi:6-pyruvoyl-tetrahydropterin synthase